MSSIEFGRLLPEYTHSSTLSVLGKDKNNDPCVKTCIQAMCQFSRLRIKDYGAYNASKILQNIGAKPWRAHFKKYIEEEIFPSIRIKEKEISEITGKILEKISSFEKLMPTLAKDDITVLNEPILAPGGNSNP
ncbi:16566_t:CDS:2 [Entrophospora sp. SA101]|nr:6149_t:CDS:2 [Entrophospora sp. SA101]CAJ0643018.1 10722_t:CDS:2 [Entrophospora sp. SA101]CAJ0756846.1 16566_t:CDS:2 [Entrophospora sp. SA101]